MQGIAALSEFTPAAPRIYENRKKEVESMQTFEGYEIKNTFPVSKTDAVMFGVDKNNVYHPYAVIITEHRRGQKAPFTYVAAECHNYAESVYLFAQHLLWKAGPAMKAEAAKTQQQGGMHL